MLMPQTLLANTYTVSSTADSGPGTLRQAILDANANTGLDTIRFQISVGAGNLFEGSGSNTYAVIELNTALPVLSGAVFIDGSTQTDSNTGSTATQSVGVDNISLASISYPDVYIVPSAAFVFPSGSSGIDGNGLSIDAAGVTIKGIAISGFGNTNTNGSNASAHSEISVLRSASARTVNTTITGCFISCDPLGLLPSVAQRRSKANGILILGNNQSGSISNNFIAHSGTYAVHFNGNTDNLGVGPVSTTIGNRYWTISGNIIQNITTNTSISAITRVNDGINLMKCVNFKVLNNYIDNVEQTGIDMGYNSDSNYIENNTITGTTRTNAFGVQAGVRIGLCSEKDTLVKNIIANNTGTNFKAGVWLDRSTLSQAGVVVKNNSDHVIQENQINNNNSSGIVLSNNSIGGCFNTKISRNSIYSNAGLGIDLNFNGTSGPTSVTFNDDGDVDGGPNNIQNFPIIDSMRLLPGNQLALYGHAPAGSTIEFFISDKEENKHGGATLNYGEGKTFIGSAVEGSAQDGAGGTQAYNFDGNVATSEPLFYFVLPYTVPLSVADSLTATATVGNNTSEFGPTARLFNVLDIKMQRFTAIYLNEVVKLNWEASSDKEFRYFEVEHSTDSRAFKSLGKVYPKSEGPEIKYEFRDIHFAEGKNYYRLRMVERSGHVEQSSILSITAKRYSNPGIKVNTVFIDQLNFTYPLEKQGTVSIQLLNGAGQAVKTIRTEGHEGMNFVQFNNLGSLPAGTYILNIQTSNGSQIRKVIKNSM
jgi:hypothetical protein